MMTQPNNKIQEWIDRGDSDAVLDLSNNNFTFKSYIHHDFPDTVKKLRLDDNMLHTMPWIPPSLCELSVSLNKISCFWYSFPTTLTVLQLDRNRLEILPKLPDSIRILELSYNYLSDIPNIPVSLEVLFYHHNLCDEELRDTDTVSNYDGCDHRNKIARLRDKLTERHRNRLPCSYEASLEQMYLSPVGRPRPINQIIGE